MDAAKKQEVLEKEKQKYCIGNNKTVDSCIEEFIQENKGRPILYMLYM